MQIMYNQFEGIKKYENFVDEMLRILGVLPSSANFDREFARGKPVEKPVESVNNFLNMRCIMGV